MACLSLPILMPFDLILLYAPFLLPVETRPSAQKQHTNMSCKNEYRAMRLKVSRHSCRLATIDT